MATLNLTLDNRRARKDGTYPLVFRIRVDKKFCDIATGVSLEKHQFNSKTNAIINDDITQIQIEKLKSHYQGRLLAYMVDNIGREDIKEIRNYLVNKLPNEFTIIEFWKEHIKSLHIAGRHGGAKVYNTSLSVISQETNLNIPFNKFGYKELAELENKLLLRGVSINGIGVYFRSFRAIFNKAINFEIISVEHYPFRKYKIKKSKTTPKVFTIEEMRAYFSLDMSPNHSLYKTWLIGKLIFCLRGINISDLLSLKQENIIGDRIIYKRKKTGKIYSIKLTDEVKEIFQRFESNFTILGLIKDQEQKDKNKLVEIQVQRRKVINAQLKKIGKLINAKESLRSYVFRYSYSNIAKQLDFSKDLIAEALGHSYGNSVTGIYLEQFDLKLVDEMNQKVINAVK